MSRLFLVSLVFVLFRSISAQEPIATTQPASATRPAVQVFNGPGPAFRFTKVDDNLLAQVDSMDVLYEKRGLVFHGPGVQAYIDAVGKRVLGDRPTPEKVTFRFHVLNDPMVNAFALPNGSVYINTGLLALLQNEAQLASIIGRETAHVYERHTYLANRSVRKKVITSDLIAAAVVWVPGGSAYGIAASIAADVSQLILVESVFGYSREQESQADRDGIAAMTAAGYDPHGMAAAFNLQDLDSDLEYEPHPTFYHDYPKLAGRQAAALAFAAVNTPKGAQTGSEQEYLAAMTPAIVFNIEADLESRRPRTALARAERLVDASPGDPLYHVLLGESYRALGAESRTPTLDELTPDGERKQRKEVLKMSEQQELHKLLSTPEGRAILQENQTNAEKAFHAAMASSPDYAIAYRELGFLYEDESRYSDAAANYEHYLQLVASTSLDRLRIQRRLTQCRNRQTGQAHP